MEINVKLVLIIPMAGIFLLCLILECIVPSGTVPETLKISMADTVAPFGAVKMAFDNPIDDSTMMIKLFPDNIVLTANLNKQKDTAIFSLPSTISGNSIYKLITESDSGSFWSRNAVPAETLYFHTWPKEVEPNNSAETADSLTSRIYGALATTDDLDWYVIDTSYTTKCVLKSFGTTVSMGIIQNEGDILSKKNSNIDTSLFTVPGTFKGTAFIVIYTRLKSAGGYYEITILR
jgi:hypothetical protein